MFDIPEPTSFSATAMYLNDVGRAQYKSICAACDVLDEQIQAAKKHPILHSDESIRYLHDKLNEMSAARYELEYYNLQRQHLAFRNWLATEPDIAGRDWMLLDLSPEWRELYAEPDFIWHEDDDEETCVKQYVSAVQKLMAKFTIPDFEAHVINVRRFPYVAHLLLVTPRLARKLRKRGRRIESLDS